MTKLDLLFASSLAVALSGCLGGLGDDTDPSLATAQSEGEIPVVPVGIETAGLLGQGRNMITEEFRGDCVRSSSTLTIPLQEASLRFGASLLKEEASDILGFNMDAKARYKLVSGSARARFSRSLTNNSLSVGLFYMADYRMGIDRLDQGSLQWVVPPGSPDWINRCGDHFLYQREKGGQLYLLYRIDFSSLTARQEFEGSVGVTFPAGEVNASVSRVSNRFVNRASVHVEAFQVGGDVTRLSSILGAGGPDANAGRVILDCSMTNLAPCGVFLQNAINYASAQTAGSFSESLRAMPADRTYLFKDWGLLGLSIPVRVVPAAVRTARTALRQRFDGQVEFADRIALLKSGTIFVTSALRAQLDSFALAVQNNLALLADAASACYEQLVDPANPAQVAACTSGVTLPVLTSNGYDASLTMDKLVVDARLPFAFGGMYQNTDSGSPRRDVANPFTGTVGCPAGFNAHRFGQSITEKGLISARVSHYICLAADSVAGGGWDFTGAFQDDGLGNPIVPNTYAGSTVVGCPTGTGSPVIYSWGLDVLYTVLTNHRFCTTGTRSTGRMTIGGVFQRASNCGAHVPNPLTGTASCPEGFSEVPIALVRSKESLSCAATHFVCKPMF